MNNNVLIYIGTMLIMIVVALLGVYSGSTWQESYAILTTMCLVFITLKFSLIKWNLKGRAKKTEKKIRPFILGVRKPKVHKVRINKADNKIIWTVEDDVRRINKIHFNVLRFDSIMQRVLGNKMLMKKVKPEQLKELKDMLMNHTKVEVIKNV